MKLRKFDNTAAHLITYLDYLLGVRDHYHPEDRQAFDEVVVGLVVMTLTALMFNLLAVMG